LKAVSVFTITHTICILSQTKRLLSPALTLYVEMMRLHGLMPAGVL